LRDPWSRGHGSALQRHADLAFHGPRSRNRHHAHAARQPISALVPARLETARRRCCRSLAGLCISAYRLLLGNRAAAHWIYHGIASARPLWAHAWRFGALHVIRYQAARELRGRHELRYFSDVLRLLGALSTLAHQGIEPAAVRNLPHQSVHPRRRAYSLRALRQASPCPFG